MKLPEYMNNPDLQRLWQIENSIPKIPTALQKAMELDAAISSKIPPAVLEFENAISKQFAALPSSKIKALKDEYEPKMQNMVDTLIEIKSNPDVGGDSSANTYTDADEYIESRCIKAENLISRFIKSVGGTLQDIFTKSYNFSNQPVSNIEQRLVNAVSIVSSIVSLLK